MRVGNGTLRRAFCCYSLAVMRHGNLWDRDPYFGRKVVCRGSAMMPLDRVFISFYKLSIVTMLLTEAVWLQLAM